MSGIFRHIPGICQSISYTRYMSRICLTYSFRVVARLCLECSRYIPHIFFPMSFGIYLDYSSTCKSACSSNAIGMPLLSQYTYFGCQGCLIFCAKRGGHACQRQGVSTCSPMWRSIDCDVAKESSHRKPTERIQTKKLTPP